MIRGFVRAMDLLAWAISAICGLLMVWLIVITGWQVFGRYVLNHSPAWVERAALLTIVYISLPMAAVGIHRRFHMSVTILVERLRPALAAAVEVLVYILLGLFGLAMAWYGADIAQRVWGSKMSVLPFPEGVTYLPLVVSGVLILLFSLERLVLSLLDPSRLPGRPAGASAVGDSMD
jgi:TRAP-type C4-dicarboxylate transport system permease small subunit